MINKFKAKMFYMILFMIILVVTIFSSEMAVRLFSTFQFNSSSYIYDPLVDWRHRKSNATNSLGFKDYEHNHDQEKNSYRIAFVGDSFTYGINHYSYSKVYPNIVEKIGKRSGLDVVSLNYGVSGYSPKQYLKMVDTYIKELTPDLVVVTIFVGNDIYQSDPNYKTQLWLGVVGTVPKITHVSFDKESYALYRVLRSFYRYKLYQQYSKYKRTNVQEAEKYYEKMRLNLEYQYYEIFRDPLPKRINMKYMGLKHNLEEILHETISFGAKLLVVLAPTEIQINKDLQNKFITKYNIPASELNFHQPQEIIRAYLRELNIEYVDLLTRFIKESKLKSLYGVNDTHFNEEGNYIAAEEIFKFVHTNERANSVSSE